MLLKISCRIIWACKIRFTATRHTSANLEIFVPCSSTFFVVSDQKAWITWSSVGFSDCAVCQSFNVARISRTTESLGLSVRISKMKKLVTTSCGNWGSILLNVRTKTVSWSGLEGFFQYPAIGRIMDVVSSSFPLLRRCDKTMNESRDTCCVRK